MKSMVSDKILRLLNSRKMLQFLFIVLFITSFAFYISRILLKKGVWDSHLADGLLFIKGIIPIPPAYPMWGYSLLAGLLKENIIVLQGILMVIVLIFWFRSILKFTTSVYPTRKLTKIINNPFFVGTILMPFIFLSLSYYSNSMANILGFCGAWLLYLAVERGKQRGIGYYAMSGLVIGLAYNFRSEVFMLGILLFFALLIYGIIKHSIRYYTRMAVVFFIPLLLAILPWITYTSFTVKQPLFSSTNAGAVMYLGLGILPNNPWNIIDQDDCVAKIARENNLGSVWSADANRYFKLQYLRSIKEHPKSFAKRIILGWRHMLTEGLYLPNFRLISYFKNNSDEILINYLTQQLRLTLGFNVHEIQWEEFSTMEIDINDISFRHYAVVGLEFLIRFLYAVIFIMMLVTCILLSLKTKFNSFICYIFATHLLFLLLTAGLIQTLTRHTTLLLPLSLSTIIVLICKPT